MTCDFLRLHCAAQDSLLHRLGSGLYEFVPSLRKPDWWGVASSQRHQNGCFMCV
jgi:hypothetical protein